MSDAVSQGVLLKFKLVERSYVSLATKSLACGLQRYRLVPKLHNLSHMRHDVDLQVAKKARAMNPLVDCCEMNEDYIGKVCRLTRRVSIKGNAKRTMQRVLVGSRLKLKAVKKTLGTIRGHL